MANYVLPIVARTRRGFPHWVDEQIALDHKIALASDASINATTKGNLLLLGSRDNVWSYFPIASGLPVNNMEVLLKLSKSSLGNGSFNNTGGAIMLSPTKNTGVSDGYACAIGSGSSSSCSLYNRPLSGSQVQLGSKSISPNIASTDVTTFVRARRDGDNLRMKVWVDSVEEPVDWDLSVKDTTYNVTNIGFVIHGRDLIINLKDIAYATNGDTASFDLPPVVDVMAGTVSNVKGGDLVNIHDLATHDIVDSIILPSSGAWTSELYNDRPVYARIERADGSEYDLLFAKYGGTYLGGDYPDGSVKDDGVPSAGEVSVLYRSNDPILGGATIAKVSAPPSGEWRVSGLQPNVPFDVVARKPNRKDVVVSGVVGVPDPDFKFTLMGSVSHTSGYLKGFLLAKGATPPVTAQFAGVLPYGLDANSITVDGNSLSVDAPMRDYGSFDFSLDITDGSGKTVSNPVSITDGERAPFVDFIGAVNSMDRGSGSAPMTTVIPSTVQEGDVLVLGVMRRGNIAVSDNNSGTWTLGADSANTTIFNQGTSIYYRTAKAGDAGKTISVNTSYSGRLIVYLSVYRGKFAPLKVVKTVSNPVRHDETYKEKIKNLAPIEHDSGFIVRAVSHVYALSDIPNGLMDIIGMVNTGPVSGEPRRIQVAYKHLETGGILSGAAYDTNSTTTDEVIPDVAVILDEIRP